MRIANAYPIVATFMLAVFIRALPETLSGPYPVGYDLLAGYAPALWAFPADAPMRAFGWAWSPLAIYILWFLWKLSNVDLYLFLKFTSPIFYGLFISSFYYMLLKGLRWNERKSFVTATIFLLQPAVLRTGWDQLREELGFLFLFVLLAKSKCDIVSYARSKISILLILSLSIVFSHQLVAVLFFVMISWQFMKGLISGVRPPSESLIVFIPSALIFVWQLYSQFICPNFSDRIVPIQLPSGSNIFVFTNYFLSDPRFLGGNYWRILAYVGSFSLYTVLPLVPFAIKGYFKDHIFAPMLIWLCIASYSIVIFPWYAFSHYWWWIMLLPIPLTVYLGCALEKLKVFTITRRFIVMLIGVLLLMFIAIGYSVSAVRLGYPYAYTYMPSSLLESCVDFADIPRIKDAINWANLNLPSKTKVIVPEKLQGFASMYLRSDFKVRIAPPILDLSKISEVACEEEETVFAIYYYSQEIEKISGDVRAIFGNVAVYELVPRVR